MPRAHAPVTISRVHPEDQDDVRAMLVDLAMEDQGRYQEAWLTREGAEAATGPVRDHFVGENHVFIARDASGEALGVMWCVLYDPGTGLEGELAELYVRPRARGRGLGRRLAAQAVSLFREKGVTLGSVWTHESNPAALAAYRAAGFRPTEHTVLTWLPTR